MDTATAVILAAIIGGVFAVIVELVKIFGEIIKRWFQKEEIDPPVTSDNGTKNTKTGIETKEKTGSKKVAQRVDPKKEPTTVTTPDNEPKPGKKVSWLRIGIIFLFVSSLVIFLDHTGIVYTPTPISNDSCPNRQNIQTAKDIEIKVNNGYVAYFMGWAFDGEDGGFFVTFKGPYKGTHSLNNGIYCPPIPEKAELSQKTVDMLMENCQQSPRGCSITKTCAQNIFAYHLFRGGCHEQ